MGVREERYTVVIYCNRLDTTLTIRDRNLDQPQNIYEPGYLTLSLLRHTEDSDVVFSTTPKKEPERTLQMETLDR